MRGGQTLLLLSQDRDLRQFVERICSQADRGPVRTCPDTATLERALERGDGSLALIDLGQDPLVELARLGPLLGRLPEGSVVLLCPELRSDVLLEAMQLGVRHCVVRSSLATDLPPVFARLQGAGQPVSRGDGRSVTVIPARGGSGATTLAINLAQELHEASGDPTLLVDGDAHYGSISTYLGLKARFGLADILAAGTQLDSALLTTTAAGHSEGLSVLVSPASVDFERPAPLDLSHLPRMLEAARQAYSWTVLDLPRSPLADTAAVARMSALTLIVFQLSVHDVRAARALRNALTGNGVDPSTILMVANRHRRRGEMVGLDDVRAAMDQAEIVTLANDYESAVRSINLGQTLAMLAPRSSLRKNIRDLAGRLIRQTPALKAS